MKKKEQKPVKKLVKRYTNESEKTIRIFASQTASADNSQGEQVLGQW